MALGFTPDDSNKKKKRQQNENVLHLHLRVVPSDEVVEAEEPQHVGRVEEQPIANSQQLPIVNPEQLEVEQGRTNEMREIVASDVSATTIVVPAVATSTEQQLIEFGDAFPHEEILETEFAVVSSPTISVLSSSERDEERDKDTKDRQDHRFGD